MPQDPQRTPPRQPGAGQQVLKPATTIVAPSEQVRHLQGLGDPALSELGLEELLDELLIRVRDALSVDTAAILLVDRAEQELVARAAKGIEEEVEAGVRVPIGRGFAGRIAAQRVAIFIGEVNDADIHNPILREKGIRSLLGVPLIVEGDLVGVLHVGSLRPRRFDERDLAVLQIAAARAAPAIERARLFAALEREHAVARLLQRSLLPGRLPDTFGVSVAARYIPARGDVGGDWYDVIELPRGLVGMAIGDVVGHGVRAAARMGQLRTALRTYAVEGHPPARALELVDRFVQSTGEYAMATAAYAVFDPETGSLRLASAGHPPPVIVSGAGGPNSRAVEITPGAPLGGFPYASCPELELGLETDEIFVFYTDGLVERRHVPLSEGIDALIGALQGATSAEDACRLAIEGMVPADGPTDDLALLALQWTALPAELYLQLPADPNALARVRRVIRRWLRARGAEDSAVTEVTLAVNEACANAIEHAYSPAPASFELSASATDDRLTISVRDGGHWRPPRGDERGRGLTIIDTAMDQVEVNATDAGTQIVMRKRLGEP